MRTITLIIVHCSATPEGKDFKLEDIDRWHRQKGWKGCGYHYVIELDGTVRKGRDESVIGAHCKNHNRHSIGVCYVGGMALPGPPPGAPLPSPPPAPACWLRSKGRRNGREDLRSKLIETDTRTEAQKRSLISLLTQLKKKYPRALILGHHDLNPTKACPCYNAAKEYGAL